MYQRGGEEERQENADVEQTPLEGKLCISGSLIHLPIPNASHLSYSDVLVEVRRLEREAGLPVFLFLERTTSVDFFKSTDVSPLLFWPSQKKVQFPQGTNPS